MICEKFREEMWEKKKRNFGEFSSNLCQGLHEPGWWVCVWIVSPFTSSDPGVAVHACMHALQKKRWLF